MQPYAALSIEMLCVVSLLCAGVLGESDAGGRYGNMAPL